MTPPDSAPGTMSHVQPLFAALRAGTAAAHAALEAELDLLRPPLTPRRFTALLERFYGFHVVWEPAVATSAAAALLADRSRLPALRRDLAALGRSASDMAALPRCEAASGFTGLVAAVGSLYVMEGSTLGGQVISRALQGAAWLPAGGLTYFSPYGRDTGMKWREFQAQAEALVAPDQVPAVVDAALATFALLAQWLRPAAGD